MNRWVTKGHENPRLEQDISGLKTAQLWKSDPRIVSVPANMF